MRDRSARLPSDAELRVLHDDEMFRVVLGNISATGARLDHLGDLPQDAPVTLFHGEVRIHARVVWSKDHQTGVQFVTPLSITDLEALRGASGAAGVWAILGHWVAAADGGSRLN